MKPVRDRAPLGPASVELNDQGSRSGLICANHPFAVLIPVGAALMLAGCAVTLESRPEEARPLDVAECEELAALWPNLTDEARQLMAAEREQCNGG